MGKIARKNLKKRGSLPKWCRRSSQNKARSDVRHAFKLRILENDEATAQTAPFSREGAEECKGQKRLNPNQTAHRNAPGCIVVPLIVVPLPWLIWLALMG